MLYDTNINQWLYCNDTHAVCYKYHWDCVHDTHAVSYCRFNPNDDTDIAGFIATLEYYYDTHAA